MTQRKKFLIILLTSFLLCFSPGLIESLALPASARIHQQTIIREGSLTSNLQDEAGNIWELIVWQEANNGNSDTYLRLVGCPMFQLDHERPLQLADRDRVLFEVKDLYTQKTPAFHVGKYSVRDILPQLPTDDLDLSFYLKSDRPVHLKIPSEVIARWKQTSTIRSRSDRHISPYKTQFLLA